MYSRVRASGFANGMPYQPSTTCGPDAPMPMIARPPERWSSVIAAIAVAAGCRADSCMIPVPSRTILRSRAPPRERRQAVRAVRLGAPDRVDAKRVGGVDRLVHSRGRALRPVAGVVAKLEIAHRVANPIREGYSSRRWGKGVGRQSLLAVAGFLAAGVSPALAKSKPDLVVKSLAGLPAFVEPGEDFSVTVTTQNKGKGKAKASVTRFALSTDGTPSGDDIVLDGDQAVKKLRRKAKAKDDVELSVPGSAAEGGYELLACADADSDVTESKEDNNCKTAADQMQIGLPTTTDLIDAEVESGDITEEEGLDLQGFRPVFRPPVA